MSTYLRRVYTMKSMNRNVQICKYASVNDFSKQCYHSQREKNYIWLVRLDDVRIRSDLLVNDHLSVIMSAHLHLFYVAFTA